MRRTTAAIGSSVFFLLAPGTLAGVGPAVVAEAPAVDGPLELAPPLIAAARRPGDGR
jgi:hypothetical protein